jgi:Pyruvate/2-oxoacid:ferredoxin oxidoreductase delta subunit
MAVRKIIRIDEEKCDGCGDCVSSCAEGAIAVIDGKARLVSETYCDGLGACLAECPQGAISIEERDAAEYSEVAVTTHLAQKKIARHHLPTQGHAGCPGSMSQQFRPAQMPAATNSAAAYLSQLGHWPVQLKLVSPGAPWLRNADILVCADCVPFAVPDFHSRYLAGKVVLVGCPKLDDLTFYYEKLKMIFEVNQPSSITVLKMEVPCCSGIAQATIKARNEDAPGSPLEVITVGIRGDLLERQSLQKTA